MLFTLTTLQIWSMASGAAKNRMLEQKRFFSCKNDAQSVADGDRRRIEIELRQCDICWSWSLKWMKLNLILLP